MYLLSWLVLIVLTVWAFERFYLRGQAPREYPPPADPEALQRFIQSGAPGAEQQQVIKTVRELTLKIAVGRKHHNL